jgi:hypothetical protein
VTGDRSSYVAEIKRLRDELCRAIDSDLKVDPDARRNGIALIEAGTRRVLFDAGLPYSELEEGK